MSIELHKKEINMKQPTFRLICLILLVTLSPNFIFAQTKSEDQKAERLKTFVLKLAESRTADEQNALLAEEQDLVSPELTQLLIEQARISLLQGNFQKTLIILRLAESLAGQSGDKLNTARVLTAFGNYYRIQSNESLALEYLEKALPLHEDLRNKLGISNTLFFIGNVHIFLGNYTQALEYSERLLKLNQEPGDVQWVAMALSNIGAVYFSQGKYSQALETHQKSLAIYEMLGNKFGVSFALHGIGNAHRVYGNYAQALDFFQKSLELSDSLGNIELSLRTLSNIGTLYRAQGKYTQAVTYLEKSLKLSEASKNNYWIIISLINLAEINRVERNYSQAKARYEKSLMLSETFEYKDGVAYSLFSIGEVLYAEGRYESAKEYAERAIPILRQTGGNEWLWRALTTNGKIYSALKQTAQAREAFSEAITIIESLRSMISGQDTRALYFATTREPYELLIDLLMKQHKEQPTAGHDIIALQLSERARARSLLEALSEARADLRQGVSPELLERERSLQQQLNGRAERQTRLLRFKDKTEEIAALQKEIAALTTAYQNVQTQIRRNSPRYAALTQPVPLTMSEIQRDLLDTDTLLLEYALGEEHSYLWVVTKTSMNSYVLPKREKIESVARRVYELLSDGKRWAQSVDINAEYTETAGQLSEMLLSQVGGQLKGKKLVIVSDGILQYIPFSALPVPQPVQNTKQKTEFQPLAVGNEIVNLPSASTLAVLRRETANRKQASKSIAVFADPVFTETDERLAIVKTNQTKTDEKPAANLNISRSLLERAYNLRGESNESLLIGRLPFTRREAEAILEFAPAGSWLKALDFTAKRESISSRELSDYRIVHFATHGLLNSEHPELSGIVLSLVNEQGKAVDGFLRLNEIFNLDLSADLVVLSACQTALGKEIRGEGLIGLTRGFMYAGSPRVVASLWKVDDVATAELMKLFYQKMLREKMRPAAALRAAKVEMLKQKRWNAPFYWAAFELQGEWR